MRNRPPSPQKFVAGGIWLDLDVEVALGRCNKEDPYETIEKLTIARRTYNSLYESGDYNIKRIDSSGTEEEVFKKIKKIVENYLQGENL